MVLRHAPYISPGDRRCSVVRTFCKMVKAICVLKGSEKVEGVVSFDQASRAFYFRVVCMHGPGWGGFADSWELSGWGLAAQAL